HARARRRGRLTPAGHDDRPRRRMPGAAKLRVPDRSMDSMTRRTLHAPLASALAFGPATPSVPAAGPPPPAPAHDDVHAVIDRQYEDFLGEMPQIVSLLGLPGADEAAHRLNDLSLERRSPMRAVMRENLAQLEAIDRPQVTGQERWSL